MAVAESPADGRPDDKKAPLAGSVKVVMRCLPCGMSEAELREQLEPLPAHCRMYIASADDCWQSSVLSRAYLHVCGAEPMAEAVALRDRFDGYVFVDASGVECRAVVELAPLQRWPLGSPDDAAAADKRCATVHTSSMFKKFTEELEGDKSEADGKGASKSTIEEMIAEIDAKIKTRDELAKQPTPLIEYLDEKFKRRRDVRKQRRDAARVRYNEAVERQRAELAERRERDRLRRQQRDAIKALQAKAKPAGGQQKTGSASHKRAPAAGGHKSEPPADKACPSSAAKQETSNGDKQADVWSSIRPRPAGTGRQRQRKAQRKTDADAGTAGASGVEAKSAEPQRAHADIDGGGAKRPEGGEREPTSDKRGGATGSVENRAESERVAKADERAKGSQPAAHKHDAAPRHHRARAKKTAPAAAPVDGNDDKAKGKPKRPEVQIYKPGALRSARGARGANRPAAGQADAAASHADGTVGAKADEAKGQ